MMGLLAKKNSSLRYSRATTKKSIAGVTTYLPNQLALKMDGAQACYPYLTVMWQNKKISTA